MAKLSKAQEELLREALMKRYCVKAYRPAQILVTKGLAAWERDDEYGGTLVATDAGRAALLKKGRS